ncbi:DUF2752 domain-containing protein [Mycobacterium sp. ACS4331]|uniref:DUF2752 domain-containing protein n=1 Tax=Mycobacterium sp. ACS4331 TaxID=1834121 RepID=UPI0007FEE057|nr:DUF2752 domain-containing protein [Mycobacterium sp. ACS4331]OBF11721.1 hypothetical protein A5727_19675 [Mycobacterium sp. ACS4331]
MAPDRIGSGRAGIYAALGVGGLATAGALTYIGLVDPHRPGSVFPPCIFKALTGWDCPACGGLRMTHDVLHGDIAAAVNDNVYLLVGIPLLLAWVLVRYTRRKRVFTWWAGAVVLVSAVAWTVVRNLTGFPLVPTVLVA